MECAQCNRPAVVLMRTSGRHLCREHFLRLFDRVAKAELAKQGRLPDSVSVLHFLRRITADHPRVELVAVTVDEGIDGYRSSSLEICRKLTTEWDIPWHVVKTRDLAGYTIDEFAVGTAGPPGDTPGTPRAACGPCGVFRRLGVNRLAREAGADAVVTGHNLDDTAQTVLMNVLQGDVDRMARMAPHDEAVPGLVPRLIPFRRLAEKEVLLYALLHGLPMHDEAECPYAARSRRFRMRDLLWSLEEESPGTRHSLLRFQDRVQPVLRGGLEPSQVYACPECGEPTSGALCKACAWKGPTQLSG
jgi:uncharacterized protein (TIGR00269 family)